MHMWNLLINSRLRLLAAVTCGVAAAAQIAPRSLQWLKGDDHSAVMDWSSIDRGIARTAAANRMKWLVVIDDPGSDDLQAAIQRAGGTTVQSVPDIGVYSITGDPELGDRLAAIPGIQCAPLARDTMRAAQASGNEAIADDGGGHIAAVDELVVELPPIDDDFYLPAQWALDAIDAPQAWETGARGRGVRVAVLDTGVDPTHPDLSENLNLELAASFVPGQTWDVSTDAIQDVDHGTHIAGIIAAADNGFGIIGVAPEAEIVPVQVLRRPDGRGPPDAVIAGIVYAADMGADVINLSLGYTFERHGGVNDLGTEDPGDDVVYTAREAAALTKAFARATAYAHAHGCTIIAAAHNNGIDADHDRDGFLLPRDAPNVVSVAATGPLGWILDPQTDLDVPAYYTNHGQSVIDLSAPGGNLDFELLASGDVCMVNSGPISVTLPCWIFDWVLSTAPVQGGLLYQFRSGTSMAAAHVSGVAALIIGQHGSPMDPAQVIARLRASAEDLGKPGNDDFFGLGRVNARRAVSD